MSFFSISRGDWMCVRGLSEDSITISMKSAAAIRSVLTTFLALPVVGHHGTP